MHVYSVLDVYTDLMTLSKPDFAESRIFAIFAHKINKMPLFGFIGKKKESLVPLRNIGITCDTHSHLLPNLDDGSQSVKDSIELIVRMKNLGYKKIICTPHFMTGFYNNTRESVQTSLNFMKSELSRQNIDIELDAAAEYYIDYDFMQDLGKKPMLTFGNNMLLFECSFTNQHKNLNETIFEMQVNGYKPVLAHPERYLYWHGKLDFMKDLHDRGVLFQLNMLSLANAYSRDVNMAAKTLVDNGLCDMVGTDLHNAEQLHVIEQAMIPLSTFDKLSGHLLNNNF